MKLVATAAAAARLHTSIIKSGFSDDVFSLNGLLSLYSNAGLLGLARQIFEKMRQRNLVSWTSMIAGYVNSGDLVESMDLFVNMMRAGIQPNEFTLGSVLKACGGVGVIDFGRSVQSLSWKLGIHMNLYVGTSLLDMYAKCGTILAAEKVFAGIMDHEDLVCWNAMVSGYVSNGYGEDAIQLVCYMTNRGMKPDQVTLIGALQGCSMIENSYCGECIHGLVYKAGWAAFDTSVMNSLIDMYIKNGNTNLAIQVFGEMNARDTVSWNTVISGYAQEENVEDAVDAFKKMMQAEFKPNRITFCILFKLCASAHDINLGVQFYSCTFQLGLTKDVPIINCLINMLATCGLVEDARAIFIHVGTLEITTWNEMITGYVLNDCGGEALRLFSDLHNSGLHANEYTFSSILQACSGQTHQRTGQQIHCSMIKSGFNLYPFVISSLIMSYSRMGLVDDSFKVFRGIEVPDLVSWSSIISAFSQQGYDTLALFLFKEFRETGERPDEFIVGSALKACASHAALDLSKCFHAYVLKCGLKDACIISSVIDVYAKSGDMDSARLVFDLSARDDDPIIFSSIITAFAQHGLIDEAFEALGGMQKLNLQPNHATFVSILSACSRMGQVDQGQKFFDFIHHVYGAAVSKKMYACLVDLLARSGHIEEAKEVVDKMPYEPWPSIWRSLLSGCVVHGNSKLGEVAAKQILQMTPKNDTAYVLLSKLYASEGKWEDVAEVKRHMKTRGIRKQTSCSWISIKGETHKFSVGQVLSS
ncbi:Pentatricopeptide repeat-containing protein [Nymphaea thermarum]|nr:Pentatricopeptide repeat-containing protein [Nymphaea thermarum]